MGEKQSTLRPETVSYLNKNGGFTKEEIDKWYTGFIRKCPTGKLREDGFKKLYCDIFPQGNASSFAGHVFRTFDVNKDGEIDFREFLSMLWVTRRGSLEERLRWVFNIYDLDADGYITKNEMEDVISALHKMAGKNACFKSDERTPSMHTAKFFDLNDRNDDSQLSFKEFSEGVTKDKLIAHLLVSTEPV